MTSKHLETITDYLAKLHGYAYFRPQVGALKERLTQVVLDAATQEVAEELSEGTFDLELSIGCQEGESEISVSFKVDHPGVVQSGQIAVNLLADDELEDLARYLAPLAEAAPPDETAAGKTIVRKKHEEGEHHEKDSAAARLKVTPEWLKSVIPCTDYSYEEIDGKKYIREYYWSKDLIERLFKIKCTKTTPEDLQYVAKECCEGDMDWARDLIARLKSPNRPEPVAKEQPQRNQGRTAPARGQMKAAPPKVAQQAKAVQQAKPAPDKAATAKAAPNERSRSRSRHKKSRSQGNDPGRKPEAAAGPKQPQQ